MVWMVNGSVGCSGDADSTCANLEWGIIKVTKSQQGCDPFWNLRTSSKLLSTLHSDFGANPWKMTELAG